MSLINEALRRARIEAARLDAAAKGVPPAALPVYVRPRRRPWMAPVAGFVAGLVVVGMAIGTWWWVRRPAAPASSQAMPAMAAVALPSPSPSAAAAVPLPPAANHPSVDRRAAGDLDAPPLAAPPSAAPPSAAPPPAARPPVELPPTAAPEARSAPPSAPASMPPPGGAAGERTYLRQADPGGVSVKVDFIVWSESRPFAQINGQLLSPGQSVDGCTLLTVERERVELESGGSTFWIRVR